tara:strand:- start:29878 stop:30150 length:273 start_codon:yes stop_codon:yes gene_type:complete
MERSWNQTIEEMVEAGLIESTEYYNNVEFELFPLLDLLRTSEIKVLVGWLDKNVTKMYEESKETVGVERFIAAKKYLDNITTRKGTAYTQ